MTEQRRLRSNATALTTEQKKKLAKDAGITEEMDQNTAEEKMKRALDDKVKKEIDSNQYKMRRSYLKSGIEDHNKNLVTPKFNDIKKEYVSKQEKTILFHERAKIVGNLDKRNIGDIESYKQIINFNNFLYQFDETEVPRLEIQDLLDVEYEQLEDLKEKCKEYYEFTDQIVQQKKGSVNNPEEEHLLIFFMNKLEELASNENNIQIFMNNIDKVESLSYNKNGTRVYFYK